MGEFALYKAVQSYTPLVNEDFALPYQRDDVFEIPVQSPCVDANSTPGPKPRKGWLYAYNRCTGDEGYVKVEHVKLLGSEVNNTIHHPSAPGLEGGECGYVCRKKKFTREHCAPPYNGNVEISPNGPHTHRIREVYFITPIFCIHCCGPCDK